MPHTTSRVCRKMWNYARWSVPRWMSRFEILKMKGLWDNVNIPGTTSVVWVVVLLHGTGWIKSEVVHACVVCQKSGLGSGFIQINNKWKLTNKSRSNANCVSLHNSPLVLPWMPNCLDMDRRWNWQKVNRLVRVNYKITTFYYFHKFRSRQSLSFIDKFDFFGEIYRGWHARCSRVHEATSRWGQGHAC